MTAANHLPQPATETSRTSLEQQAADLINRQSGWKFRIDRGLQTLIHYRWSQMFQRTLTVAWRRLAAGKVIGTIDIPSTPVGNPQGLESVATIVMESFRNHLHHGQSSLEEGQIVLLNCPLNLGVPLQWNHADVNRMPHLWRFQLQYQEFLLAHIADAKPDQQASRWQTIWTLMNSWMEAFHPENTLRTADAWHPFCISRRIPVWIWLLIAGNPEKSVKTRLLTSLNQQALWLHDHLETELGGNHLLENLTALALAAVFLDSNTGQRWLSTVERKLITELDRQVLPSGEHFERSPMYHCQVLRNLLTVSIGCARRQPALAELCRQKATSMLDFLTSILHPDGEIPLFGDSGFGESADVQQIIKLASLCGLDPKPRDPGATSRGDYWIYERDSDRRDVLIFDAGAVGAAHLPAHAHCDLLGLEASVGGRRWVVDSGNFNYESDSMRQYCRSSMAHNVITVDGSNSCNIWSRFRMGRRGKVTESRCGRTNNVDWVTATHDGFRGLGVSSLSRLVSASESGFWLVADVANDRHNHRLIGYLHLAPGLSLDSKNASDFCRVSDGDLVRHLYFFGVKSVAVSDGWYCEGFGFREKSMVVVYECESATTPFGWILTDDEVTPRVDLSHRHLSLQIAPSGGPEFEFSFD